MAALSKQQNFAVNTNKSQVYIEDSSTPLAYNYKTNQWSSLTAYAGIGLYSVESGLNIGLARVSGSAVDLQQPDSSDPATQAIITTGESTFSDGSRRIITGIRPLLTANDAKVSLFTRDTLNPSTRTNYFLYSEQFDDASWTKTQSSITADQVIGPDGLTTADLLDADGSVNIHSLGQTAQDVGTSTGDVAVSVYFKYDDHQYMTIHHSRGGTAQWVEFDIQNGLIENVVTNQSFINSYGIDTADNGFFRCWIVYTNLNDSTPAFDFRFGDGSGALGWNQAFSTGVYVWGAMVEQVSALGQYIKSTATAGTATLDQTTESTINSRSGVAAFRAESRYHRVRLRVNGGFTTILGADIEYYPTGEI
jgi:hypothetical protein